MFTDTINLKKNLYKKKIFIYIMFESTYIFIQENKRIILKNINKTKIFKKIEITIYNNDDWQLAFQSIQKQDLFSKNRIFSVTIHDSAISLHLISQIKKTINYYHNNIKIFSFPRLYKNILLKNFFINNFKNIGLIIDNSLSCKKNIKYWLNHQIKRKKIHLTSSAKKFLLDKCYQNIQFNSNFLKQIFLIYPNTLIKKKTVIKFYKKIKLFKYYDWIKAIIKIKKQKSIKILSTLKKQKYDYIKLINCYKTLIYIILYYKEKKNININVINFQKYKKKIIKMSLNHVITNNHINDVVLALKILKKIEICIQNNQKKMVWMHLKTLSIILN